MILEMTIRCCGVNSKVFDDFSKWSEYSEVVVPVRAPHFVLRSAEQCGGSEAGKFGGQYWEVGKDADDDNDVFVFFELVLEQTVRNTAKYSDRVLYYSSITPFFPISTELSAVGHSKWKPSPQ